MKYKTGYLWPHWQGLSWSFSLVEFITNNARGRARQLLAVVIETGIQMTLAEVEYEIDKIWGKYDRIKKRRKNEHFME